MKGIVFKGKHSSEFGLIVNKVHRSLLPPLVAKTIKIPNRPGEYFFGNDKGMRIFDVDFTLVSSDSSDVWKKIHDINGWLFSEEEEELIFDQEQDVSYYAFVSGETKVESLATHSTFTITFMCPDPYGYGPEIESSSYTTSKAIVPIGGQEKTYPIIVATFNQPSTFFTVATKNNHVHVGNPAGVDEITVPREEKQINDPMSSTAAWTSHTAVDGGTVAGSFMSDGYVMKANSYGTGTAWHGPCLKKMIATPIQDFKLEAFINLSSLTQKEMGRAEVYLLDANGVSIGKVAVKDAWADCEKTMIEQRVGGESGGQMLMAYVGNIVKRYRKITVKKKINGKLKDVTETITEGFSTYADFYGVVRLSRVGNVWTAYVGKVDPKTGVHNTRLTINWTDKTNKYSTKVAGIAIHVGQYGEYPFPNTNRFHQIVLTKINANTSIDVPEIVDVGDELTIDCETAAVFKNGEPFLEELDISSEFFSLLPGNNEIAFGPDNKCDIQVYHRGRYL